MGIVRRKTTYYERKKRVGGKVISEYVGSGAAALEAYRYDLQCRDEYRLHRLQIAEEQQRLDTILDQLSGFCEAVDQVFAATLIAAGYHQHNRGEWRKKRVK